MNVAKGLALVLVLVFLISSCIGTIEFVSASSATENTWETGVPMPVEAHHAKAAVVNGIIFVIGETTNYAYVPATGAWVTKTTMPTPRRGFGMAVYQNKIFTFGGAGETNTNTGIVNEVYDPATDTWETKQSMLEPRYGVEANVVGDEIYVIGAWTPGPLTTQVYNVANDSWYAKKPIPYPTLYYSSAVSGGKIYIIGGSGNKTGGSSIQIYDPVNDSWSMGAPMSNSIKNAAAAATTGANASRRIYLIGGEAYKPGKTFVLNSVQVYNPENDTWTLGAPMPTARGYFAVAVVNERIYAIGGNPSGLPLTYSYLRNNEVYTPFGYGTPDPAYVYETTPPKLSLLSPLSQTYNVTNVTLVFTMDKPISWAGYSLDGESNITTAGNTTLIGLSSGLHNVTVSANDTYGNMAISETVALTVAEPEVAEPFPTATVAVASAAFAGLIGAGLIICLKKHKRGIVNKP